MKKYSRRHFLAAPLVLLPHAPHLLYAAPNTYPNRPIRIVVGFQAGGTADVLARMIAAKTATLLGQPVIVENKPSAAAILAADHVAKAAPDGYTLFLTFAEALVSNPALYRQLPYQPQRDFSFIAKIAVGPLVIAVSKSVPATNLATLIAHAKSGAVLNFGSWGAGSHGHLLCEALNKSYALKMQHVAYKGESLTIQDLLGEQIQIAAGSIGAMRAHLQSGALNAIGVIGKLPSRVLPTVPTLFSQGATDSAFTTLGWVGLVGPANMPPAIVARLSETIRDVLAQHDVSEKFLSYGFEPTYLPSVAFYQQWQRDAPIWTKLIRDAGVTLD
jgi:tripartite-type tricarboxylate transporter receptor subunit TctC